KLPTGGGSGKSASGQQKSQTAKTGKNSASQLDLSIKEAMSHFIDHVQARQQKANRSTSKVAAKRNSHSKESVAINTQKIQDMITAKSQSLNEAYISKVTPSWLESHTEQAPSQPHSQQSPKESSLKQQPSSETIKNQLVVK